MKPVGWLPFLLLAACTSSGIAVPDSLPPLPPSVAVDALDETYAVTGTTMATVTRSLRENGPVVDGRRVFGRHRWNVSWRYRSVPTATHCTLTDVRVSLMSRILLPEWSDRDAADPELVRAWGEFLEGLRTHELGHRALAYRAAAEIERELRRHTAPGCEFIGRNANDRGDFIVSRYRAAQDRYDEETGRGRTQGAVWPRRIR